MPSRILTTFKLLSVSILLTGARADLLLPSPPRTLDSPSQSHAPTATAKGASGQSHHPAVTSAPKILQRCEDDACNGNTEGGEQPIAVTTTIQTTVLVPCTTYVTVTNDITTTLTSWSTEIQTKTITVSDTVSVVVMSPTPDIKSTIVTQTTNIAWSYTSYWTEAPTNGPSTSIISGGGGHSYSPDKTYQSPAPTYGTVSSPCQTCGWQSPSDAWTHTSAAVYAPSGQPIATVPASSTGWTDGPVRPFDPASRFTGAGTLRMAMTSGTVCVLLAGIVLYVVLLL